MIAVIAAAPMVLISQQAVASDYKYGIEQSLSNKEMRVKIDHLQEVDSVITANDQALLDKSRAALKADLAGDH